MLERARKAVVQALGIALCVFTIAEVNYPQLRPQSQLAIFAALGLVICFLIEPAFRRWRENRFLRGIDLLLVLATLCVGAYIVVQTEPAFEAHWLNGESLGDRAAHESPVDFIVGGIGLLLVIEATRRSIGLALPLLAIAFLLYAYFGRSLPDWAFPHRGQSVTRIIGMTYLHQGVYGVALYVMFTYVFLFVIFGAFLEVTGATGFIIGFSQRLFRKSAGAPAKVSVLSSGLMGSLSGSAVANTATTGSFTIPVMRSAGFEPHVAGGVEAAASSGGALVPPVMGAGAYMMIEIINPPVTYLQICKAALIPAILYYFSLFMIVHFYSRRIGARKAAPGAESWPSDLFEGAIFISALGSLIAFLVIGYTPFRAVSLSLGVILVLSLFHRRTRVTPRKLTGALTKAAASGVALVAAAACVGIIIGVVTGTGVGTKFPATILPLAEQHLTFALLAIMGASLVLGMGLPSAVCYLLLATLVGPALGKLGVVPLAAHLFIFYFGMMAMVTPPVALAGYAAGSIAGANVMRTSFAAFRFALVGFTLPYMFVYKPELLLLGSAVDASPSEVWLAVLVAVYGIIPLAAAISGHAIRPLGPLSRFILFVAAAAALFPGVYQVWDVSLAVLIAVLGIIPLAAAISGYLVRPLGPISRFVLVIAAAAALFPGVYQPIAGLKVTLSDLIGVALLATVTYWNWRAKSEAEPTLAAVAASADPPE